MGMSSGGAGGGRNSRHRVMSEINVTPLVDVMLVLLIIFMVTVPLLQQGLEVNLPETANSGVQTTDEPFMLVISKEGHITAGNTPVSVADLRAKLESIFQTRKNKQVYIQADKKTEYGAVAEVMGEVRAAGIYNISLITLPKTIAAK
jgi:biopolymer transport protein TolR